MQHNEPGREPTDAAMFPREAQSNTGWTLDYGFIRRVSDRTRKTGWSAGMEEAESVLLAAEAELSGQLPMPDTPAPDEVAQLKARVAELEAANKSLKAELASLRIHTTPPWEPMFPGKEPTDA